MNRKILFALVCTLLVTSSVPVFAANKGLTITVIPYEMDNPGVEIKEGQGIITDEEGKVIKEWDLDGKGVTFASKTNEIYEVELKFEDNSKYIDYTYTVVNGATMDDEEKYWEKSYDLGVYTRRILPTIKDAVDGSIIKTEVQIYNENNEKVGTIPKEWTAEDVSSIPGLPAGTYLLKTDKLPDGYFDAGSISVEVPDGPAEKAASIPVEIIVGRQSGALTIKAVNKKGEPIKGVTVKVFNQDTEKEVDQETSDENGQIKLWDLPIGEYADGKIVKWYTYKLSVVDVPKEYEELPVEAFEISFEDYAGGNETFIYADKEITLFGNEASEEQSGQSGDKSEVGSGSDKETETTNQQQKENKKSYSPRTGDVNSVLSMIAAMESALYIILRRKQRCE